MKTYSLEESLRALQALRQAAGLEPEQFPLKAFVGMMSDEIEALRKQGKTDDQIAGLIRESSGIDISAAEIAENYAEDRHDAR